MKPGIATPFLSGFFACLVFLSCNNKSSTISTNDTDSISMPDESMNYMTDPDDDNLGATLTEEQEKLAKKYNNLLVFHADDTMQVNKVYTATLALAKNTDIEGLTAKVLDASDAGDSNVIVDTTIMVGKRMKARLKDPSPKDNKNFRIEAEGSEEQSIGGANKEAFWHWDIEPLQEGDHQLKLLVEVIISDGERFDLPAREIPVTIYAKKLSFFTRLGNFFSKYWQWVITGIMVPLIVGWLSVVIRQRAEQKVKVKEQATAGKKKKR